MKQKTLQEQYNLIQEGKGNAEVFMKAAKKQFPNFVRNAATLNETISSLKHNHIISENMLGLGMVSSTKPTTPDWFKIFNENMGVVAEEAKAVEKKPTKDVVDLETKGYDYKDKEKVDNIYGEAFLKGYYTEMKDPKNTDKTVDELKEIVAKNLAKDRLYYTKEAQFGIKGVGYETEVPGLGTPKEPKGKYKSSGYGGLKESMYNILGGERPFTDTEMRENIVEPNLGPNYTAFIMFKGPKGEYDSIKKQFAQNTDKWKTLYRSRSYQGEASISPDGNIIKASILDNGGIVGAIYVNNSILKEEYKSDQMEKVKLDEVKKPLKEYTDYSFSGQDTLMKLREPSLEGENAFEEFFPMGVASSKEAEDALMKHDKNPIKQRMGRYAPMFAHVQYHDFTDVAGEKYRVHQKQYYNSNFKDQDPNFNPEVTVLTLTKLADLDNPSPQAQKDIDLGQIAVKTNEYIKDLRNLNISDRVSESVTEAKKPKKETANSKLAEIEKNGKIATIEIQIDALDEIIESKNQRISMVNEDENLSELVDKNKMKEMQREIKELEKRKAKMEKLYEKMCGKRYAKKEVVDEVNINPKATEDRKEADKFAGSDPKAGSTIKGTGFDWEKKYDPDEEQKRDEDEIFMAYDDEGKPL